MERIDGALPTFVASHREEADLAVAREIAALMAGTPGVVLGLATGHTPVQTYRELIRMHRLDGLDFSRVTTFNLDEYVDLPTRHPASFHRWMRESLFDHVNVDPERTHLPDGNVPASDLDAECTRYEQRIAQSGGIDLQILGIGLNGHIAFNEPGSARDSRTRVVELTTTTIEANAPDFVSPDEVPRRAITMGMGTIVEARRLRILAFGEHKAPIVRRALHGPTTPDVPVTLLRDHPDVQLIVDAAAASEL